MRNASRLQMHIQVLIVGIGLSPHHFLELLRYSLLLIHGKRVQLGLDVHPVLSIWKLWRAG